jgi:hypothetical protein
MVSCALERLYSLSSASANSFRPASFCCCPRTVGARAAATRELVTFVLPLLLLPLLVPQHHGGQHHLDVSVEFALLVNSGSSPALAVSSSNS